MQNQQFPISPDFSKKFGERTIVGLDTPIHQSRLVKEGKFSYIPSPTIIKQLNAIFTPSGWSSSVLHSEIVSQTPVSGGHIVVTAVATVRLTIHGYTYHEDVGVGVSSMKASNVGKAIATAIKTAVSLGLVRSSRKLGSAFGLDLYRDDYAEVHPDFVDSLSKDELDAQPQQPIPSEPAEPTPPVIIYPKREEVRSLIENGKELTPERYAEKLEALLIVLGLSNKLELLKTERETIIKASKDLDRGVKNV